MRHLAYAWSGVSSKHLVIRSWLGKKKIVLFPLFPFISLFIDSLLVSLLWLCRVFFTCNIINKKLGGHTGADVGGLTNPEISWFGFISYFSVSEEFLKGEFLLVNYIPTTYHHFTNV